MIVSVSTNANTTPGSCSSQLYSTRTGKFGPDYDLFDLYYTRQRKMPFGALRSKRERRRVNTYLASSSSNVRRFPSRLNNSPPLT